MSAVLDDRSAPAVRDFTLAWLGEHLPAGWMAAVDAGDTTGVAELRTQINYDDWCTELGEAGLAGAVKTSGAKGLHVFVPIDDGVSIEDAAGATRVPFLSIGLCSFHESYSNSKIRRT